VVNLIRFFRWRRPPSLNCFPALMRLVASGVQFLFVVLIAELLFSDRARQCMEFCGDFLLGLMSPCAQKALIKFDRNSV